MSRRGSHGDSSAAGSANIVVAWSDRVGGGVFQEGLTGGCQLHVCESRSCSGC